VRWIAGKTDGKVPADLSDNVLRDAFRARKTGGTSALRDAERAACEACFAAGTQVATLQGERAIERLHVGDTVLSENPTTGKVETEAVQAVIQDPVSPLLAVDLSDGSAITVTAHHPFWVDGGAQLAGAGWFAAGRLQAGDELRTASGAHVMVVGLRHDVGHAVVYTLTVAKDHTFFVGAPRVLVHNCNVTLKGAASAAHEPAQAIRFGQLEGGGEFAFLGNSSQGIEGFFTAKGSAERIPVSLKDFSGTGNLRNIIGRINKNANNIAAVGQAGKTVLFADLPQFTVNEVRTFVENGPLLRTPTEGVFQRLIFACKDGTVEVYAGGVVIK